MDVFSWVIFGLLSGIVTNVINPKSSSVLGTVLLGMLGALLGGFLANLFFTGANGSKTIVSLGVVAGVLIVLAMQRSLLKN
jgi:uncharacterized membrane protein YeaQ/YmgE (transglycosylase-associated protein family)